MGKLDKQSPQSAEWLDKATKLKEVVLAKLESTPEPLRHVAPRPDGWSPSSLVEHLVLVEENIVGLWRQKLLELPSPKIRIGSDLIIEIAAIVTTKTDLRVPTVAELVPKDSLGVPELKDRWKSARESLIAALPGDKHAPWILHPAFGPLSGELMGKLLASHLEHHLRHWPAPKA